MSSAADTRGRRITVTTYGITLLGVTVQEQGGVTAVLDFID